MPLCLVVDGYEVVCKVATRMLFDMGCTAERATTGHEAMEHLARNGMPDLIIVSNNLTDISAEEMVRTIRGMEGGREPSVVCSMIDDRVGTQVRLKRAGADAFLKVPFDGRSFRAQVGHLVEAISEREAGPAAAMMSR